MIWGAGKHAGPATAAFRTSTKQPRHALPRKEEFDTETTRWLRRTIAELEAHQSEQAHLRIERQTWH